MWNRKKHKHLDVLLALMYHVNIKNMKKVEFKSPHPYTDLTPSSLNIHNSISGAGRIHLNSTSKLSTYIKYE